MNNTANDKANFLYIKSHSLWLKNSEGPDRFLLLGVSPEVIRRIGGQLIAAAETAVSLCQREVLPSLASQLRSLGGAFHYAAIFYDTLYKNQIPQYQNQSRERFSWLATNAPPGIRARSLLALGLRSTRTGAFEESRRTLAEIFRLKESFPTVSLLSQLGAIEATAAMYSLEGSPDRGCRLLEEYEPLARLLGRKHPTYYFNALNNLAVAKLECGRVTEALEISRLPVRFANAAYPEWGETATEIGERIARRDRIFVRREADKDNSPPVSTPVVREIRDYPRPQTPAESYASPVSYLCEAKEMLRLREQLQITELSGKTFKEVCALIKRLEDNPTEADSERLREIYRILTSRRSKGKKTTES